MESVSFPSLNVDGVLFQTSFSISLNVDGVLFQTSFSISDKTRGTKLSTSFILMLMKFIIVDIIYR